MPTQADILNNLIKVQTDVENKLNKLHKVIESLTVQRDEFATMANQLACIIINGEISSNDVDLANEVVEKVGPYLTTNW